MFDISFNGIITVNRGDSFDMPLFLNAGTNLEPCPYKVTENDIVYFGLMEPNQPFETAIVRKKYTIKDINENGDIVIRFKPQDTQCLLPGKYYYQVKVQTFNSSDINDYDVTTAIDKTPFFIME